MAVEMKRVSEQVAERAPAKSSRYMIAETDIPGFWLVVTTTGKKSFVLRYRVGGGRAATIREPKIGDWPAMKTATSWKKGRAGRGPFRMRSCPSPQNQHHLVALGRCAQHAGRLPTEDYCP